MLIRNFICCSHCHVPHQLDLPFQPLPNNSNSRGSIQDHAVSSSVVLTTYKATYDNHGPVKTLTRHREAYRKVADGLLHPLCCHHPLPPEDMPQLLLSLHFLEPKQEIFYYFQLGISRRLSRYDTIRTYLGRYKYEHQCRNAYFNA